jgi:hypothetical protein
MQSSLHGRIPKRRLPILWAMFAFGGHAEAQILFDPNASIPLPADYDALLSLSPNGPPVCGHLRIKAQLLTTPILAKGEASFEDMITAAEAVRVYRECVRAAR